MSHTHASPPAWLATELSNCNRTGSDSALNFTAISTAAAMLNDSATNGATGQSSLPDL